MRNTKNELYSTVIVGVLRRIIWFNNTMFYMFCEDCYIKLTNQCDARVRFVTSALVQRTAIYTSTAYTEDLTSFHFNHVVVHRIY